MQWRHTRTIVSCSDVTRELSCHAVTSHVNYRVMQWRHTWTFVSCSDVTRELSCHAVMSHANFRVMQWRHTWTYVSCSDVTRELSCHAVTSHVNFRRAVTSRVNFRRAVTSHENCRVVQWRHTRTVVSCSEVTRELSCHAVTFSLLTLPFPWEAVLCFLCPLQNKYPRIYCQHVDGETCRKMMDAATWACVRKRVNADLFVCGCVHTCAYFLVHLCAYVYTCVHGPMCDCICACVGMCVPPRASVRVGMWVCGCWCVLHVYPNHIPNTPAHLTSAF